MVADGLCRLLLHDQEIDLLLVDHDRVEPHNLLRQAFYAADLGKFKSQVVAERLARQYGRRIAYSVQPFDKDLLRYSDGMTGTPANQGLLIGCVDNAAARRSLFGASGWGAWWLDAGNGFNSGQVLFGCSNDKIELRQSFNLKKELVDKLPSPGLQLPTLLIAPSAVPRDRDCAEDVEDNQQSPVINQAMAALMLEFVRRILTNDLYWMGAYLDLAAGTLQTIPAEPEVVARMLSINLGELFTQENNKRR